MNIELISDYLIRNAMETPDDLALTAADRTFTFAQLNNASNKFANGLLKRGIKPGDVIMSAMPRDSRHLISMFGIFKIGGVLIPVDINYPQGRIDNIRKNSNAVMMVGVEGKIGDVLFEDIYRDGSEDEPEHAKVGTDAPCIILYTSGSTGIPKGVILKHRTFVTLSVPCKENRHSELASLYCKSVYSYMTDTFVAWYCNYFVYLANRSHYVFADLEASRSPMIIAEQSLKYKVANAETTPSRFLEYLKVPAFAEMIKNYKYICMGGECISESVIETIHKASPDCIILNNYGQTETAGTCMVGEAKSANSPVYPTLGWKVLILDENNNEVAVGERGELLLGGDNVLVGYMNLPEEMKKKTFIKDGVKYFRTGDIAERCENNGVRIGSRVDYMIKLRGLRMEPGEIESVIRSFHGVKIDQAIVKVNKIHGFEHLVAYYSGENKADEVALRKHLRYDLPDYMVPDYFMYLKEIPKNANGKMDRKNLPEIEVENYEIVPPSNHMERSLLDICKQIVGHEDFGVTITLEEMGFTSLTYIDFATRIFDKVGVELKLSDLMAGGVTVRSLAESISGTETVKKEEKKLLERYPIAPQQYQFMTLHPVADLYREFIFFEKWTDATAIRRVFVDIFNSFPYLYTTFRQDDGEWYQIPFCGTMLKEEDVPIIEGEPDEEILEDFCKPYIVEEAGRLFDIEIYKGKKVIVLLHIQHALIDHVFMENLITYISESLRKPNYRPSEQADYYEYSLENVKERPEKGSCEFHEPGENKNVMGGISIDVMQPALNKYRIQPAEYLFGLLSQAYLDVCGKDEAEIYNIFGGRDEARYFNTAGYFPISIPVKIKKDPDFLSHVKSNIVDSLRTYGPNDDYSYNAIVNQRYKWPYVSFNCTENIDKVEDFELISLHSKNPVSSDSAKLSIAHINFLCTIYPQKGAVINLFYDTNTIDEEKARSILKRTTELSKSL